MHQPLRLRAPFIAPALAGAPEDFIHLGLPLVEKAATGIGDGVNLAPILLQGTDVPHVFEHLQRGIDSPGAGAVKAAGAILELTHDVVAVSRLILERIQDQVLQVAFAENALP